jgi:alpha-glucosidase
MLSLYRRALRARRARLGEESLEWLTSADEVLAFRRGPGFACVVNVGDEAVARPAAVGSEATVLLASGPLPDDGRIPGTTAVWYADRAAAD